MRSVILVLCVYCAVPFGTSAGENVENIRKLFNKTKTEGYDKRIRPLTNQTQAITVYLGLTLTGILDFDERKEALTTSGYFTVIWKDQFLRWNTSDYGDIDEFFVPQNEIWKPDLLLSNSYRFEKGFGHDELKMKVRNDGNVFWFPYQLLETECSVNTRHFPFDTQSCSLIFKSASYTSRKLKLWFNAIGFDVSRCSTNSQWDLISTWTEENDNSLEFKLRLRRRPSHYTVNVLAPICILSFLGPFAFMLPSGSGERCGFSVTLFLTYILFLTVVSSELPKNAEQVSLISIYLTMMTITSGFSVIISLLQGRLVRRDPNQDPPGRAYLLFYRKTPVLFGRRKRSTNPSWIEIMSAVDDKMFWLIMTTIVACTVLLFLLAGNEQIE